MGLFDHVDPYHHPRYRVVLDHFTKTIAFHQNDEYNDGFYNNVCTITLTDAQIKEIASWAWEK